MPGGARGGRCPQAPGAGRRCALAVSALLGALAAAALVGVERPGPRLLALLGAIGGAYRVQHEIRVPDASLAGRAEYLVVLSGDEAAASAIAYFAAHADIEYLSESIYPRTHRVALPVPVGDLPEELESQPFVRFVVRNLPFFFCH